MRALVTGATGFVGPYLIDVLEARGYTVTAAGGPHDSSDMHLPIDLLDPQTVIAAFELAQPDAVFHLAAQSFVPRSVSFPDETYRINTLGTAQMLGAMRQWRERSRRPVRLLYVSSAEVYGLALGADPVNEDAPLQPVNPYGASKAAAEMLVLAEVRSLGADAVIARPFNHTGPGQDARFVVPALVRQLRAVAEGTQPYISVGNLEARRDFLDVRDVVEAYAAIVERGERGAVYNVCSGRPTSIREILGELIRIAHVAVEVREDPALRRAADLATSYGSNEKLRRTTGWEPRIALRRSLQDIYSAVQMSGA